MHQTIKSLVQALKEGDQDHEFYPTTDEIIKKVVCDVRGQSNGRLSSVLDIGAGNGKVLSAFSNELQMHDLYAIEKSEILCQRLPSNVFILGTDFYQQSLIDKPVDVTFCNPPYSEFEVWTEKIIRQSCSRFIYLIVPCRWVSSTPISDALSFRKARHKVIGTYDFESAERTARAIVDVVRVTLSESKNDAFDRFFSENFAELEQRFEVTSEETKQKEAFGALVVGASYPQSLVGLYMQEMEKVERNYRLVGQLDSALMKEFDISPLRVKECLKAKLSGMKLLYWNELFSHLEAVTDRLTSSTRRILLDKLAAHCHVDFTLGNIYAVILWVIKNANEYIDSQLISTYEKMVEKANVKLYKSNHRVWVDERWRYSDEAPKNSHFSLDYRIVTHRVGGIKVCPYMKRTEGLIESGADLLGDLLTIARNLGFQGIPAERTCLSYSQRREWTSGEVREFYRLDGKTLLFDVRAFQNGNLHLRLNQDFIRSLNVEFGRLRGWINSPQEAADELKDPKAAACFNSNKRIGNGDLLLLP